MDKFLTMFAWAIIWTLGLCTIMLFVYAAVVIFPWSILTIGVGLLLAWAIVRTRPGRDD